MTPNPLQNYPVEATMPMVVRLEAQGWNTILGVLKKQPYEVVAELIAQVNEQLLIQAQQVGAAQPNGRDTRPGGPHAPA